MYSKYLIGNSWYRWECRQWCTGKQTLWGKKKKKSSFVVFVSFHDLSVLSMAYFKLPMWHNCTQVWEEMQNQLSQAGIRHCQPTICVGKRSHIWLVAHSFCMSHQSYVVIRFKITEINRISWTNSSPSYLYMKSLPCSPRYQRLYL